MIEYILGLLSIALGLIILVAVGCAVTIVGYIFYQITRHIIKGIEEAME